MLYDQNVLTSIFLLTWGGGQDGETMGKGEWGGRMFWGGGSNQVGKEKNRRKKDLKERGGDNGGNRLDVNQGLGLQKGHLAGKKFRKGKGRSQRGRVWNDTKKWFFHASPGIGLEKKKKKIDEQGFETTVTVERCGGGKGILKTVSKLWGLPTYREGVQTPLG